MPKLLKSSLSLLPFLIVFIDSLSLPVDHDLGWHLKFGQYLVQNHRFLYQNTFSSEMAGYRWFNSSWGTDLTRYLIFDHFNFLGLTILSALIVTLSFYFIAKVADLTFWEMAFIFPLALFALDPLISASFRAQLISILFVAILFFIFQKYEKGDKKMILLTIPFFFIWSNLHAEFPLGLAIFGVCIFCYILKLFLSKRYTFSSLFFKAKIPLFVFILSSLITLINPYGLSVYFEAFNTAKNPAIQTIQEFIPIAPFTLFWYFMIGWGILLAANIVLLFKQKKFLSSLQFIIPVFILYLLSFGVHRYAWPMFFISIPIISPIFILFKPKSPYLTYTIAGLIFIASYIFVLFFKPPNKYLFAMNWRFFCYIDRCSPSSADFLRDYLKKNPTHGKLYTFYDWGGFLIWNYPDIKPSVDGRMALWLDTNGNSPYAYYYAYLQSYLDINYSTYDIVYIPTNRLIYQRMKTLVEQNKWQLLYEDSIAAIFARIKNPN